MAVICGAGGLGKTTLAAATAQHAQRVGRAVFWVRWQDDETRLADDLTRVVQALGLRNQRLEEAQNGRTALVDVVWEYLSSVKGWVVVVDNVDTPAKVGPGRDPVGQYRGWLRPDGAGLLVVTSRDRTTATWGARARVVQLDPLDANAAGGMLQDAAPTAGTVEEARELGVRLGGLPLALEAAGRYLGTATSRYQTYTAYQHALDAEFADLLGAEHPRATDPVVARSVVRHTWDISLDQLHTDGATHARPLLHLLALLEAAPIPLSLITPALLTDATGHPVTATALDAALAGLHQYGLLGTPQTAGHLANGAGGTAGVVQVVLHPLVREVMALPRAGTDPTTWLAALDTHLTQAVHDSRAAGRAGWPTGRLLAPHLPQLLDRAAGTNFLAARNVLDELANALSDAGAATEELVLRQHVLDAEHRTLGPDHPHTLTSRNNLATALSNLGR
ncbi:NB-ARC domain-containing protein, partial [Streptomyces sp. SID1121]|uniref:NB-ARC domain-containing protein n=1 Tax=Streptomyces sp. SID1121 TaxID=3425888 RepID=UPI00405777E5